MTKTKRQLRAEAVERLRKLDAYVDGPESIIDKLAYGLDTDRFNYHVEIEHIIDLLIDNETCPNGNGTCPDADGTASNAPESHGDAPESVLDGDTGTDKGEGGKTPQTARECADSREKLEADVRWEAGHYFAWDSKRCELVGKIIGWLDRQAAITKRHWMEICGANANANIELKRQIDVLEANNAQLHTLIAELQDERDIYREKLGRAIDAARTLRKNGKHIPACYECLVRDECANLPEDSECPMDDYDALLEWLMGEA